LALQDIKSMALSMIQYWSCSIYCRAGRSRWTARFCSTADTGYCRYWIPLSTVFAKWLYLRLTGGPRDKNDFERNKMQFCYDIYATQCNLVLMLL
jgi:hypothetical protein